MGCPYLGVTLQNQDIFIEPAAGGLLGKKFSWQRLDKDMADTAVLYSWSDNWTTREGY